MTVLVGKKAPNFKAATVKGNGEITNIEFHKEIEGKYALLFFYPLDFTFVCPTELVALDRSLKEFTDRNIAVFGISIDSQFAHYAWRNTPVEAGGIGEVKYSLVADVNHAITQAYGVEHPEAGVALRGTFLIDKNGIVRSQIINDLPLGRSVDEILRLFDALQYHEQHGEVCPANWSKGKPAMKADPEKSKAYFASNVN